MPPRTPQVNDGTAALQGAGELPGVPLRARCTLLRLFGTDLDADPEAFVVGRLDIADDTPHAPRLAVDAGVAELDNHA